jgi:hypothetical protein
MKEKQIIVSWAFDVPTHMQIDFGLFKAHPKNKIKVDKKTWESYVEARFNYEVMQRYLVDLIDKKVKKRRE